MVLKIRAKVGNHVLEHPFTVHIDHFDDYIRLEGLSFDCGAVFKLLLHSPNRPDWIEKPTLSKNPDNALTQLHYTVVQDASYPAFLLIDEESGDLTAAPGIATWQESWQATVTATDSLTGTSSSYTL